MKFLISFLLFFTGIVLGLAAAGAGLVLAVSRKNRRKKLAVPIELEQV